MISLIILDGFGIREEETGNAIKQAGTPYLDKLKKTYPSTLLSASGEAVGLAKGQMGNSEVGHLVIGGGRVFCQDLTKINEEIENGSFYENKELCLAVDYAEENNSTLHIVGLVSDGGVHSHINHLNALVELAKRHNVERVVVHAFLDGRDTLPKSALTYLNQVDKRAKISSLCGRFYAMDREKHYERVMGAYDMLCLGQASKYNTSYADALEQSYEEGVTDEFVEPTIIGKPETINSGDSVIFFNFRTDRARELCEAFCQKDFKAFPLKNLKDVRITTFTKYEDNLENVHIAFPEEELKNTLAEVLSNEGKKQFHIAETTKYAHVTFFFNGGREKPFEGEDRKLIESYPDQNFANRPLMRAIEISEEACDRIATGKYDFVLVNLSNADMVGHTGDIEATKKAITCIDKCAYMMTLATLLAGGEAIIIADHGNAEEMQDAEGNVLTSHTTNPVPFILVSEKNKNRKLKDGQSLAVVAPTILTLMKIEKPKEMGEDIFLK